MDLKGIFKGSAAKVDASSAGQQAAPQAGQQAGADGATGDAAQSKAASPLDAFKFLVPNTADASGADSGDGKSKQVTISRSSEAMTPENLNAIASKLDFSSAISPASLAALQEGKPEALLSVMNDVGRAAYMAALQHSGAMNDTILDNRLNSLSKSLPDDISKVLTDNGLREHISSFENPVVKEGMKGIADRVRAAHPDATPKEVAKMTQDYFLALAQAISPEDASAAGKGGKGGTVPPVNWLEYALAESS